MADSQGGGRLACLLGRGARVHRRAGGKFGIANTLRTATHSDPQASSVEPVRLRGFRALRRLGRKGRVLLTLCGLLTLFLCVWGLLRWLPKQSLAVGYPSSVAVYDQNRRLLRLTLAADDKYRLWRPLKDISPTLIEATLLHEDRHYYHHFAVNPVAMVRALYSTYLSGVRRVGGSTISMQVARMRYHIYSRSLSGKVAQMVTAIWLELRYSKDEILEAYLNLVPCGKNIEGVPAASLIYFGKPASKLQLYDALTLAVIPQSPSRRTPGQKAEQSRPLSQARTALWAKWVRVHPEAKREEALVRMPMTMRDPSQLPFRAPHLVDGLLPMVGRDSELVTTLDLALQQVVERQLRGYIARNRRIGLRNAAAMLVDTRTMAVKAVVGSADFNDPQIDGQVNGTQAKRSPGSTLKPFIYALGIDQGVLHPLTMLKDTQLSFGAYSPENFDGRFAGPLSAKEALIRSRNVPALTVASKLQSPSLYDFLRTAGISRLKSEQHYGLALVLGGAEVTMEELATLYAMLGNRGVLRPLRFTAREPQVAGVRLLSDEASFITMEMLKENPRPEYSVDSQSLLNVLKVAWKTGTSYGFRDAWTAGIVGPYVLVVWLGNFNGEGNPVLVGVTAAAPMFFSIVDALRAHLPGLAEVPRPLPKNASRVTVCAVSGQLPTKHCAHKQLTWFVPGRSPIELCQIHREVQIDNRTGLRSCGGASPSHPEVFEFWPSDLLRLFRIAGLPRRVPPPAMPGCSTTVAAMRGQPPKITSPLRGVVYTLRPGLDDHDTVALTATTDADAREVYWFANETFLGTSRSGGSYLWHPSSGKYTIRAVDDQGRSDARELQVEVSR